MVTGPHIAVDAGSDQAVGQGRAQQQVIDPQAGVAGKGVPEIFPEGVDPLIRVDRGVPLGVPERLYQFVGRVEMDVTMNIEREPLCRAHVTDRETTRDSAAGWQAGEQQSILHNGPAGGTAGLRLAWRRRAEAPRKARGIGELVENRGARDPALAARVVGRWRLDQVPLHPVRGQVAPLFSSGPMVRPLRSCGSRGGAVVAVQVRPGRWGRDVAQRAVALRLRLAFLVDREHSRSRACSTSRFSSAGVEWGLRVVSPNGHYRKSDLPASARLKDRGDRIEFFR
jgi:hypothetical protein